jgi:hypothetical protein
MGPPAPYNEDFSISLPLDNSVGYDTTAEGDFDGSDARYLATYGSQINPPNNSFESDAQGWLAHEAMASASMLIQDPSLDIPPINFQNSATDTNPGTSSNTTKTTAPPRSVKLPNQKPTSY